MSGGEAGAAHRSPVRAASPNVARARADAAAAANALESEDARIVHRRTRAGLVILLIGGASLTLADLVLHPEAFRALAGPKLVLMACAIATLALLQRPLSLRQLGWLSIAAQASIFATTAVASVLTGEVTRAPLLYIAVVTTTAYIAAPAWSQAVAVVIGWICFLLVVWSARASAHAAAAVYPAVAFLATSLFSIYSAHELQRSRRERRAAEEALVTSRQLEADARNAHALARVGRELQGTLERRAVLERVCRLGAELVSHAAVSAVLWDTDPPLVLRVRGGTPGDLTVEETTPDRLEPWVGAVAARLAGEDCVELAADGTHVPLAAGPTADATICVALRSGARPIGLLAVAVHDHEAPPSHPAAQETAWHPVTRPQQRILLQGIARLAESALGNAALIQQLRQASRLKSEFVSTISHELRTPLHVILGRTDMAEDPDCPAGDVAECLGSIRRASGELLTLVEQVLEVGRLDGAAPALQCEPVELRPLWEELHASAREMRRSPGVALEWLPAPAGVTVTTDRAKLAVIVRNLVGNALKFTPCGSVRAAVEMLHGELVLTVTDTGIGIRPEDRERIFELFQQVDGSDSRHYGGAGLGLYLVRRYVDELGGHVQLESRPGEGTRFAVRLPHVPHRFAAAV